MNLMRSLYLVEIRADVAAQQPERQIRRACRVHCRHAGVRVLLNFDRQRPILLHRIPQPVQRPDTRIPAPREDDLLYAPRSDQHVVDHIRRHADHRQVLFLLADNLMTRRIRDQVRKPFQRDNVAILDRFADCFGEGCYLCQGTILPRRKSTYVARSYSQTAGPILFEKDHNCDTTKTNIRTRSGWTHLRRPTRAIRRQPS